MFERIRYIATQISDQYYVIAFVFTTITLQVQAV